MDMTNMTDAVHNVNGGDHNGKRHRVVKRKDFLSSPHIQEHYALLEEIGLISYIDNMNAEIRDYHDLFYNGLHIFHYSTINDIIETAVLHLARRLSPESIAFLWKPYQNKDEITIKAYGHSTNYRIMDLDLDVETLAPFEVFFNQNPNPNFLISGEDLVKEMNNTAAQELCKHNPKVIMPILSHGKLYGLILLGGNVENKPYTTIDMAFIRHFTSFISIAIQNNLNYDHSLRDVKTGLYNYGFFMMRLTEELARMKRNEYHSSLIVIDVDFFKKFNDNYGHIAGDKVLEHIATTLKQSVRVEDVPSRFGGEEFTVLLPDTKAEQAFMVAERLRKSIANLTVPWMTPLLPVTISLGIHTFDNSVSSIYEIVDKADKALYISKENGRNRSTVWRNDTV